MEQFSCVIYNRLHAHFKKILGRRLKCVILSAIAYCFSLNAFAQKSVYGQISNEVDFSRDMVGKWSLEFNIGEAWTDNSGTGSVFEHLAQVYGRVWVHYNATARWKFSGFYGYYYNEDVPEIQQSSAPEWRSGLQAIYYLRSGRPTLSFRVRSEDRHIKSDDQSFEAVQRMRIQTKMVLPLNGKVIKKSIVYAVFSEEFMFKTRSKVSGDEFFDRNKITAILGYGLSDDVQLELGYCNEFLPRSQPKLYNTLQINFVFNNFLRHLSRSKPVRQKQNESTTGD